jgi:hypothetical protein
VVNPGGKLNRRRLKKKRRRGKTEENGEERYENLQRIICEKKKQKR